MINNATMKSVRRKRVINHKVIRPPKVAPKHDPSPSPYALPLPPSGKEDELKALQEKLLEEKDKRIEDLKERAVTPEGKESPDKWQYGFTLIKIILVPPGPLETNFDKLMYAVRLIGLFMVIVFTIGLVIFIRT